MVFKFVACASKPLPTKYKLARSPSKERDNDVAFTRCMPTAEHGNLKFLGWWFESTHREISDDGRTEDLFDDEIKLHVPVIPRGYTKNLGSRSMGFAR